VTSVRGLGWYTGPLKVCIEEELSQQPALCQRLGMYRTKFIAWCAAQRIVYEPDLCEEVQIFERKFILCRLENIDYDLWRKTRQRIFERDDYTCRYCGVRGGRLEIDHVIPISRGGSNHEDNLATACMPCNRRKKDKVM